VLAGKTAIVTGGGQGLGRGIALVLAQRGAAVTVTGRTPAKIDAVVAEIEAAGGTAQAVAGDVGDRQDVQAAVDAAVAAYGGLDILINNAQSSQPGLSLLEVTDDVVELTFRSGALGTLYAMQASHPHMKARGGGSIVNFGSSTAITGDRGFGAYVMAKEAIRGLTRVAANEWGRDGIRVNVVCPAGMSPGAAAFRDENPERWAKVVRQIPLGRMGDEVDDIGTAVAALCGDDLRFVTGATLLLDGGRLQVA
jgi:NAD(P)-dependent dehydrogenase (short-subunit alcohol dehydrogenase family)